MIREILEGRGYHLTRKTANEYSSPCPFCGGEDRFCIWPQDNRYWCRQCGAQGDEIQLLRDLDGLSFQEAAKAAGREDKLADNRKEKSRTNFQSSSENQEKPLEEKNQAEAADKARKILEGLPDASGDNPYLRKKGVKTCPGLKAEGDTLVVPVWGPDGKLASLQRIFPDGQKKFFTNGKVTGGYFPIRGTSSNGPLYVCEGIATGLAIHEATAGTVLCAFSVNNLLSVARVARKRYPKRSILICADDDRKTTEKTGTNPGIVKAREAAEAVGAKVIDPGRPGDFNDLYLARGLEVVRRRLSQDPLDFPADVINSFAGYFAHTFSSYMESPMSFFFMAWLTCLGAVVGDKLTLRSEIQPQPRLYTILLGESADDRKSTAIHKTVDFFKDTIETFAICHGVGSEVGLIKKIKNNPNLLLMFDEFRQFVSKAKIENSALLPCVNTLFESNRYENKTKRTEISVDGGYLSLLAASTVQTYKNIWTPQFIDIGFTNRLFLVPGRGTRKFPIPDKISDDEKRDLREDLARVLKHVEKYHELTLTEDARRLYEDWYINLDGVHSKRLDAYALRFMALLAVNELKTEVDVETVEEVITLMDWQKQVREQHDPVDAENSIAKVEEGVRRALRRKPHSDRDLKKAVHVERVGLWVYQAAIKNLQSADEIQWEKKTKKWIGKE